MTELTNIIELDTARNLEEILQKKERILLYFYTDWCKPCSDLAETIRQIAEKHPQSSIVRINADKHDPLCAEYEVASVPRIIIFKKPKAFTMNSNARSDTIMAMVDKIWQIEPPKERC